MFKRDRPGTNHVQPQVTTEAKRMPVLSPGVIRFFTTRAQVRIDKAQRLLGYQPAYDFETGMQLVEQWAKWAHLV
jgi:nucleoside-diphosphate-sugar epimerase